MGASEEVQVTVVASSANWNGPAIGVSVVIEAQGGRKPRAVAALAFNVVAGPVLGLTPTELDMGEQSLGVASSKLLFLNNAGNRIPVRGPSDGRPTRAIRQSLFWKRLWPA